MRTDTLKQLRNSCIVGLLFGLILNSAHFYQYGFAKGIGQFLYVFILMGGTFFLTGMMSSRRGRHTTNMRIYAKKLHNEGDLIMDAQADMIVANKKNVTKGWLYLNSRFVIFANTPDPNLIEKKAIRMPLSKVSKIERFKPTPFTNDGIEIFLDKGISHKVLVGKTDQWLAEINSAVEKRQNKKSSKKSSK